MGVALKAHVRALQLHIGRRRVRLSKLCRLRRVSRPKPQNNKGPFLFSQDRFNQPGVAEKGGLTAAHLFRQFFASFFRRSAELFRAVGEGGGGGKMVKLDAKKKNISRRLGPDTPAANNIL